MSRAITQTLMEALRGSGVRARLVRGGMGSFAVKASNVGLSLAVAVVLARVLGPEGYGVYSYVFALVSMIAIPAQFGLPALTVRETAKAQSSGDWNALRGIWRWTNTVALGLSLFLATIGMIAAWLLTERFTDSQTATFVWGLVLMPLLVLGRLRGAALRGLRHVVAGQLPEMVLRPGLLVVLVLAVAAYGFGGAVTPDRAMALHALAATFGFGIGAALLHRLRPKETMVAQPRFEHRAWAASTLPLGFNAGMMFINRQADILLLGFFVSDEQVGIYRIAMQGSLVVAFGLQAVNMVVAPQIARLHNQGEHQRLQRLAKANARVALAVALPAAAVFVLLGEEILGFVVGVDYLGAAAPLAILATGHLVNAGMGSVGLILNMSDNETIVSRVVALVAMFNIVANLVLIPMLGMSGAAFATAATLVLWKGLLSIAVSNRLNINSTAFGRVKVSGP